MVEQVVDPFGAASLVAFSYGPDVPVAYDVRDVSHACAGIVELEDTYAVTETTWTCVETLETGPIDYSVIPSDMRATLVAATHDDLVRLVAGPPVEPQVGSYNDLDVDGLLDDPQILDRDDALAVAVPVDGSNETYDRCLLALTCENALPWSELWKSVVAHAPERLAGLRRPRPGQQGSADRDWRPAYRSWGGAFDDLTRRKSCPRRGRVARAGHGA